MHMNQERFFIVENVVLDILNRSTSLKRLPINPFRVAESIGIDIKWTFFDQETAGQLVYDAERGVPVIHLNVFDSSNNLRFTLAYLIANHVLRTRYYDISPTSEEYPCKIQLAHLQDSWSEDVFERTLDAEHRVRNRISLQRVAQKFCKDHRKNRLQDPSYIENDELFNFASSLLIPYQLLRNTVNLDNPGEMSMATLTKWASYFQVNPELLAYRLAQ